MRGCWLLWLWWAYGGPLLRVGWGFAGDGKVWVRFILLDWSGGEGIYGLYLEFCGSVLEDGKGHAKDGDYMLQGKQAVQPTMTKQATRPLLVLQGMCHLTYHCQNLIPVLGCAHLQPWAVLKCLYIDVMLRKQGRSNPGGRGGGGGGGGEVGWAWQRAISK